MSDYDIVEKHYMLMFPTKESLGEGADPLARWQKEYDRVANSGLSATLITSHSADGASAGGQRNFDQKLLLAALLAIYEHYMGAIPTLPRPSNTVTITYQP